MSYYSETDNESEDCLTDTETNNSEYFFENDEEDIYEYEPEEQSLTKYNITLCQNYNENYHGNGYPELNNTNLILHRIKIFDIDVINYIFDYIINEPNVKLEIAECVYLPSGHCIGIIKTFWLKLIQRSWKNVLKERKRVIKERMKISSLKYREIYGSWPCNCISYPRLKGLLSSLS